MDDWKTKVGGMIASPTDPRDYEMTTIYSAMKLPETYNVGVKYNVHNQTTYNNCAAHALSSYVEILLRKNGAFKEISFPWYYGDRNYTTHKDEGLISRDLLKAAQKDGGLYLSDYSKVEEMKQAMYTFNRQFANFKSKARNIRLANYYQCATVQQVKEAIYKYGSCMLGTTLFESFGKVARGETLYMSEPVIDGISLEPMVGGHMMLAVGWIKDYFIVQNSWGEEFGNKGYFYFPFSLATWSERHGFPFSLFEAWAIDGVYLNGKLISYTSETAPPVVPESKEKWYKTSEGKWRYKLSNGSDAVGWLNIDKKRYYFKSNGDMAYNQWQKNGENWYWLRSDGAMANNQWQKIDSRWYWFDENGVAIKGWKNIDGVDYYFAEQYFGKIKECQCMVASE